MPTSPADSASAPEAPLTRHELSRLLDLSSDLIFSVESTGQIRFLNRAAGEAFGFTPGDAAGLNFFSLVAPQDHARLAALFSPTGTDEGPRKTELQLVTRDERLISLTGAFQTHRPDATPAVMLGVFANLMAPRPIETTQQQKSLAEQQIIQNVAREKELVELKAHFISMVSHELRTPLAALSLGVDFLAKYWKKLSAEKITKSLKTIDGTVRQLRSVLDDVLVISRDQEQRLRCHRVPVDLAAFCPKIAEEAGTADQNRHPITVRCSAGPAEQLLDPQLLSHILMNLLSNACKYSPDDVPVELAFESSPNGVVLTVSDRGIGIPAEDQERLFNLFFRGSNVGTIGGTGLGLIVVRRCAEAHDGTVTFESSLEAGTRFTVTLPASSPSPSPA